MPPSLLSPLGSSEGATVKRKAKSPATEEAAERRVTRSMTKSSPVKTTKTVFTHDVHHGLTPPDAHPEDLPRVRAVLRSSKFWEMQHPGIAGQKEDDPVLVDSPEKK